MQFSVALLLRQCCPYQKPPVACCWTKVHGPRLAAAPWPQNECPLAVDPVLYRHIIGLVAALQWLGAPQGDRVCQMICHCNVTGPLLFASIILQTGMARPARQASSDAYSQRRGQGFTDRVSSLRRPRIGGCRESMGICFAGFEEWLVSDLESYE